MSDYPATASTPRRDASSDIVHAHILRGFPELIEELGGDPDRTMAPARLSRARLAAPGFETTYRQVMQALELAASDLRCSDFGLRLARRQSAAMIGPLGQVMRNSTTFGHALDYVVGHAHAHSPAARIWRADGGRHGTFIGHDILLDSGFRTNQAIEQILLLGHLIAVDMTGGRARARRVHVRHQPLSSPAVYRRYFHCEIAFGQAADGIFYSDRDLASPIVDPDERIYRAASAHIEALAGTPRPSLHAAVRSLILQHLGTERCTRGDIAAGLDLNARTLHRKLAEEGTSFQAIKDEVRRNLMLYYVERTGLAFHRISETLGFAEQSVMTRCCTAWFGVSPRQIRARAG